MPISTSKKTLKCLSSTILCLKLRYLTGAKEISGLTFQQEKHREYPLLTTYTGYREVILSWKPEKIWTGELGLSLTPDYCPAGTAALALFFITTGSKTGFYGFPTVWVLYGQPVIWERSTAKVLRSIVSSQQKKYNSMPQPT